MKRIWKKHESGAGVCLCLLLFCVGCGRGAGDEAWTKAAGSTEDVVFLEAESEETRTILVHVCGEVQSPGVYVLDAGSRIRDAVAAAGGMKENAAADYLNLARPVEDGEKIRVPDVTEIPEDLYGGLPEETKESRVDLNTADAERLMTLPGIGKAKAAAILAYREEHGAFSSVEEIRQVSGIGEAVYEKLKEFITV
ncbi:MAG: hypothetical protein HFI93_06495 [Lachnospiraceae bacterium]|nr:hypothetical protein [Lachnospiraceae bacterium]